MKMSITFMLSLCCIQLFACNSYNESDQSNSPHNFSITDTSKMIITIGTSKYTATLLNNATAIAFKEKLPMTIKMNELNGNEKYADLPYNLPSNASNPGTIQNGDLMLYGSGTLVLFYKTFSTQYSYTPIGRIDNPSGLAAALGSGNPTVMFETNTMNAQNNQIDEQSLDAKQKSIVSIAALTAVGNLALLKTQCNIGLDAGLSINEIKEVLVQLYAYCGFPRCLNGINTFMTVVEERKSKGITDKEGRDASPIPVVANKYETGKKTLQNLTGVEETGPKTGANAFAPVIDVFLKEHLFADIFSRDVLTYQQRELATISVLSAMDGVAPQLQFHLAVGMNIGLTENQLKQVFSIIETNIGVTQAETARTVLSKLTNK